MSYVFKVSISYQMGQGRDFDIVRLLSRCCEDCSCALGIAVQKEPHVPGQRTVVGQQ
jgi:hypothetical protein